MKQAKPNFENGSKQKASAAGQASDPLAPSSIRGDPFGRSRVAERPPKDALRPPKPTCANKVAAWLEALLKK